LVYSGFHSCLKEILIISTQFFLDNYNENQSKLQQLWLEGISTLVTSMFSKSHLGLYSGQMLLFLFFLLEVNSNFLGLAGRSLPGD